MNDAPVPENTRCLWYRIIHDIIPTNVRLPGISMVPSDTCRRCTATDTLEHRLIACGEARTIWQYTINLLARKLRTIPSRTPHDSVLRPQFNIWPPKRHGAILWVVANVVIFRIQQRTDLTLHDFMDFLLRSRWKLMCHKRGRDLVGNYLTVLGSHWWTLTFWRRNYFFNLAHPVYKILIIQESNTLELWNKMHFEEKKRRFYTVFKIFSTNICWINM